MFFTIEVSERVGDHGLVSAAVIEGGEYTGLVMSCRVLGLSVEHSSMRHIIDAFKADRTTLSIRIIETSRNSPVRNIYRDNGFIRGKDDRWRLDLSAALAADRAIARAARQRLANSAAGH